MKDQQIFEKRISPHRVESSSGLNVFASDFRMDLNQNQDEINEEEGLKGQIPISSQQVSFGNLPAFADLTGLEKTELDHEKKLKRSLKEKKRNKIESYWKSKNCFKEQFPMKPQFTPQRFDPSDNSNRDTNVPLTKQFSPQQMTFKRNSKADDSQRVKEVFEYPGQRPDYWEHGFGENLEDISYPAKTQLLPDQISDINVFDADIYPHAQKEWHVKESMFQNYTRHEKKDFMKKYQENFRVNFKTEICKIWLQTGKCEFFKDCTFAHGYEEMNQKSGAGVSKNYKTKLCKQWHEWTPKFCRYGDKCQFVHEDHIKFGSIKHPQAQSSEDENSASFSQDYGIEEEEDFSLFIDFKLAFKDIQTAEEKTQEEDVTCSRSEQIKIDQNEVESTFSNQISSDIEASSDQSDNESSLALKSQRSSSSCCHLMESIQNAVLTNDQFKQQVPSGVRKRLNIFENITIENPSKS